MRGQSPTLTGLGPRFPHPWPRAMAVAPLPPALPYPAACARPYQMLLSRLWSTTMKVPCSSPSSSGAAQRRGIHRRSGVR